MKEKVALGNDIRSSPLSGVTVSCVSYLLERIQNAQFDLFDDFRGSGDFFFRHVDVLLINFNE